MSDNASLGCFVVIVVVVLVFGWCSIFGLPGYNSQVNGEHVGYITAVEDELLPFKYSSVYVKTDLSSSQEDTYCLPTLNEAVVNKVREAAKSKKEVVVKYNTRAVPGIFHCETEITDVVSK